MRIAMEEAVDRHELVPTARMVGLGAAAGLGWGALMRAWMRFISTDPEFSWGGTLFILGAATVVGAVLGLARARRRRGGGGWWRLSLTSLVLLGAAGAVMWPTVVAWGAALGRRRPWWLVTPLAVGGALLQVDVIRSAVLDDWRRGTFAAGIAVAGYVVMLAIEAWAFSVAFEKSLPGVGFARWKRAIVAVPMAAVAALSLVIVGAGA